MSRVCVKGLPRYASEASLRAYFSGVGDITDVKIARTKDGVSRQFAFVGFKGADDGAAAVKKFNKAFMDTSRLAVEPAKEIGEEAVTRTWSRHTKAKLEKAAASAADAATSGAAASKAAAAGGASATKVKDPAKFAEFMALMQAPSKGPAWTNDDENARGARAQGRSSVVRAAAAAAAGAPAGGDDDAASTDSEEYAELESTTDKAAVRGADAEEATEEAAAAAKAAARKGVSDMDFLRSKMSKQFVEDATFDGTMEAHAAVVADEAQTAAAAPAAAAEEEEEPDVGESGRLFVRNLPFTCVDEDVSAYFAKWGKVAEVKLVTDANGKCKGFGYVLYVIPEQAVRALAESDGKIFQGRILHILPAKPERVKEDAAGSEGVGDKAGAGAPGGSSFKSEREAARRDAAVSGKEAASVWNSLFIRADTTVSAMAEKLGIKQSDVLDRDASNMAVRLALAETQIISETKEFLKAEGVSLSGLEAALEASPITPGGAPTPAAAAIKRSATTVLVKNLPFTTEASMLRDTFGRFGPLLRCVMPPSRAIALIEFAAAKDAKRAFSMLAYSRFQRVPLYLEWAPEAIFVAPAKGASPAPSAAETATPAAGDKRKRADASASAFGAAAAAPAAAAPVADAASEEQAAGNTVYVKNVSWNTTEEQLRDAFAEVGGVRSVRIPQRRNPKYKADAPGVPQWLSMGYGFVEFATPDAAKRALKTCQGKVVDEHALQLRLSSTAGGAAGEEAGAAGAPAAKRARALVSAAPTSNATKLLVRNLAFEATKEDLQTLFAAYGAVKNVRMPKKFNGQHRGFAFIEFLTNAEAASAMEALAATHLYGRHLVLEWATAGDDKAGAGAGAGGAAEAST